MSKTKKQESRKNDLMNKTYKINKLRAKLLNDIDIIGVANSIYSKLFRIMKKKNKAHLMTDQFLEKISLEINKICNVKDFKQTLENIYLNVVPFFRKFQVTEKDCSILKSSFIESYIKGRFNPRNEDTDSNKKLMKSNTWNYFVKNFVYNHFMIENIKPLFYGFKHITKKQTEAEIMDLTVKDIFLTYFGITFQQLKTLTMDEEDDWIVVHTNNISEK
jgi:hypothetical protein